MTSRKSLISIASGFVLAMGLVVILVLITGPFAFLLPLSIQKNIPFIVLILSLLLIMPLLARRLNRLDGISKIMGWTLVGIGTEFLAFPVSLLFVIKSASSPGTVLLSVMIITLSVIFGATAGLIAIATGIFLLKRR